MSATVAAALKKIAVYILTDKKALKVVGGIVLGIIIIIIMPIVAIIGIFTGSVEIDTGHLHEMIQENQSASMETWNMIETSMTDTGYSIMLFPLETSIPTAFISNLLLFEFAEMVPTFTHCRFNLFGDASAVRYPVVAQPAETEHCNRRMDDCLYNGRISPRRKSSVHFALLL